MGCRERHRRGRWIAGVALLVGAPLLTPVLAPTAASANSGSDSDLPTLPEARAEVVRSERRLNETTANRDAARAALGALDARSAELATELADARAELRSRAVVAYIAGDPDEALLTVMGADDVIEASVRRRLMQHAAERSAESVEAYDGMKSRVDPDIVQTAERLQRLDQDVTDATNAVLAARAYEAEAERQLAERQRQARLAAQMAAAATTTTVAPAPTTTPSAEAVAAGELAPPPPPAPTTTRPLPVVPPGGPSEAQWAALRQCESSGNYRAVSASGKYRGAYQFDYRTWAGLGGTGDPAAASPAEQDARARQLYAQRGWRPWPVCGRHLI